MQRVTIVILSSLICLTVLINFGCGKKPSSVASTNRPMANLQTQTDKLDNQQITNRIREIIALQLSLDSTAVDVNAPLTKQKVAADELDIVEIIMSIEEAFGIEIKDEEVSGTNGELSETVSVKKLAEIVSRKKTRK